MLLWELCAMALGLTQTKKEHEFFFWPRNGICYVPGSSWLLISGKCLHCVRICAWGKGPAHVCF